MRYVRRMREAYTDALAGVRKQLAEIEAEIDDLERAGVGPEQQMVALRARFIAAQDELVKAIEAYTPIGVEQTATGQRELVMYAIDNLDKTVQIAAGRPDQIGIELGFTRPETETLEQFVGFAGNGSPLDEIFAEVGNAARSALQEGMASGIGPRATARMMRQVGQGSYQRMETIARTEIIRASREATRQSFIDNQDVLEGWMRVCAGDARTCMVCFALHGTIHATDEIMPSHPNCRCAMVPIPKPLSEISGDPDAPDVRPTIPTREALFATLDEDDQREVLGKSRYELWRNGMSLSRFGAVEMDPVWGPTAVPVKLVDLGA